SGQLNQFVFARAAVCATDRAVTAEHALLHSQFLHLPQDHRCRADIGPEQDRVNTRLFDYLKLAAEVGIAGLKLLFDHDRMSKPPCSIAKLDDSEAAEAIIYA